MSWDQVAEVPMFRDPITGDIAFRRHTTGKPVPVGSGRM